MPRDPRGLLSSHMLQLLPLSFVLFLQFLPEALCLAACSFFRSGEKWGGGVDRVGVRGGLHGGTGGWDWGCYWDLIVFCLREGRDVQFLSRPMEGLMGFVRCA